MCTAGRPKREGTPDRYPSTANNPIPQDQSSSAQLYYIVSVALHRPDPLRQPLIGVFGAVHLDVLAMVTGSGDTTDDRPEKDHRPCGLRCLRDRSQTPGPSEPGDPMAPAADRPGGEHFRQGCPRGRSRGGPRGAAREDRTADSREGFFVTSARQMTRAERIQRVEPQHPALPVSAQCKLLALPRSSVYYQGK